MDIALAAAVDAENPIEGDLRLTNGQLTLVEDLEAIGQHLRVRLRWIRGEWFLDQRTGVPYFDEVFVKGTARSRIESRLRATILGTPGIVSLVSLALTVDTATRAASLAFTARTSTGGMLKVSNFVLEP